MSSIVVPFPKGNPAVGIGDSNVTRIRGRCQEMPDLHTLWALKEGRHKWNPSVKRDRRGTSLKAIFSSLRVPPREDQDDSTVLQNVDRSLDR